MRPVLLHLLDGGEGLISLFLHRGEVLLNLVSLAPHQCNIRQVLIQELLPQSLHSLHCIRMLLEVPWLYRPINKLNGFEKFPGPNYQNLI